MTTRKPHPIQPLVTDEHGTIRFQKNAIVVKLLEVASAHGCGLNELAVMDFTVEDRMQLAQLIGYSRSGFGELSYVTDEVYAAARTMSDTVDERDARLEYLRTELRELREAFREPVARLFSKHPDDFLLPGDEEE